MTYDFQSRLDYLGTRMKEINAVSVTITRGGVTSGPKTASFNRTDAEELVENLVQTEVRYQDFMFLIVDYDLDDGNGAIIPDKGDLITVVDTGDVFQVVPVNGTDSMYEYTTSSRNRIRVHTSQTD